MYASVLCNGQHITRQHQPVYTVIGTENNKQYMERSELTLSFHNLIKRGTKVEIYLDIIYYSWIAVFVFKKVFGKVKKQCNYV